MTNNYRNLLMHISNNIHKITVRNKSEDPDKISTGFNTEVLIDGQPLKGVRTFS